jgi:hypothetical protein
MKEEIENKILVIYIGVAGIRSEDIETYTQKVVKKIMPVTFQGEIIIIPTQSVDTRIECINPKYIIQPHLIQKHIELIKELNEHLKYQLNILKDNKKRKKI